MTERNIAFKCTYNDGTIDGHSKIGFNGVCSNEIIKWNIKRDKVWCNKGLCKKYYLNDFKGSKPKVPCYESKLFTKWEYDAGWDHKNKNVPRKIRQAGIGNLALLTTRFPGDKEKDRKIFGFYKIAKIKDEVNGEVIATKIIAGDKYKIKLTADEARHLNFWDFYSNDNSPDKCFWGTGLFRYFDIEVIDILDKARNIVNNKEKKSLINEMYNYFDNIYDF